MLNPELKLNPLLFDTDVERVPTRNGFGEGLVEAARADDRVVGLCCDLTESTRMHHFRDAFPDRFIEMGVAEQNLASVASGMAAMGKIPFAASYAMFNPGRNWEQIRTTICYNDVPVKIIGGHAGISVAWDGGTHQAIEDIALTRVIPRMEVVYPCDSIQALQAVQAIAKTSAPTYLRLEKQKTPVMTTIDTPFELGKAQVMYESKNHPLSLAIITAGSLTYNVLQAVREMDERGVGIRVINMHTIKPLDKEAITQAVRDCGRILTVEEHQKAGGLGSAVVESICDQGVRVYIHGIDDLFGESGNPEELLAKHGLDVDGIKKKIEEVLA
ncbi:MAG: transketolase family protein [Patescibacteria group bacterium]